MFGAFFKGSKITLFRRFLNGIHAILLTGQVRPRHGSNNCSDIGLLAFFEGCRCCKGQICQSFLRAGFFLILPRIGQVWARAIEARVSKVSVRKSHHFYRSPWLIQKNPSQKQKWLYFSRPYIFFSFLKQGTKLNGRSWSITNSHCVLILRKTEPEIKFLRGLKKESLQTIKQWPSLATLARVP